MIKQKNSCILIANGGVGVYPEQLGNWGVKRWDTFGNKIEEILVNALATWFREVWRTTVRKKEFLLGIYSKIESVLKK